MVVLDTKSPLNIFLNILIYLRIFCLHVFADFSTTSDGEEPIPLDNVKANILKKVLIWAERHADDQNADDSCRDDGNAVKKLDITDPWDLEFLKVDQETLFELVLVGVHLCLCACMILMTFSLFWGQSRLVVEGSSRGSAPPE